MRWLLLDAIDAAVFWLPSELARLAVRCVGVGAVPALRAVALAAMASRRAGAWLLALDLPSSRGTGS